MTTPKASGAGVSLPAIEFAERTHPGRDPSKQVNEDASGYRETALGHLAVVCDGMGGHEGGREASHLALATIFEMFDKVGAPAPDAAPQELDPARILREAIEEANRRVYALSSSEAEGAARSGATVVAILHHPSGTEVAHAGDSRCYLIHAGSIVQLTKDHSVVQQMVDAKLLTPEQAAVHPDANRIARALGIKPDMEIEVRPQPVVHVAGDVFVLCSDGLSDLVEPAEIQRIASGPAAQAVGQLVDLANARGGHDNITVQIVKARESAFAQPQFLAPTVVETRPPPAVGPSGTALLPALDARTADARTAQMPHATPPLGSNRMSSSAPVSRPPATTTDEDEPAARPARRSPIVLVGILLGLVGLLIAGAAVYLVLNSGAKKRHPIHLDGTGAPAAAPPPPAPPAPAHAAPDDDLDAAPLPSLTRPPGHHPPRLKRDH